MSYHLKATRDLKSHLQSDGCLATTPPSEDDICGLHLQYKRRLTSFLDDTVHHDAAGNAHKIEQALIQARDVDEAHLRRLESG